MKKLFTLFSLLLISISGMLAANVSDGAKIYFDASEYPDVAKQKVVQLMVGHSGWSQGYKMDKVDGYDNIYLVTMPKWDGCTEFCFFGADAQWGGESQKMGNRLQWMPAHTDVIAISSNVSGTVGFGGKPLKRTDNYQLPVKAPVITIGAAPEFATTTVGETSTATVKYTVENSEEKPEISLDNDAFKAEDAEGTITITFAPTEAKEYTATLTLTIGEVKASIELAATAKEADAPAVPEIINLVAGEIAEIYAGETTEFEISYELLNAEEATTTIEGEGFTIKKQDKGTATIEFAPTEAKTYTAVVTVTSGETIKTLEISATAKKVPVVVTISFVNPDWGAASLYAWVDGGENLTGGDWPGIAMTKGENNKFTYDLTIPEDGVYKFIINNNNNGLQSVDMPGVTESTCYILGAKTDNKYALIVSETCEYAPAPEPEPIEPYYAIRGTMTDWDMAKDIKLTANDDASEYSIQGFEVDGTSSFKVIYVDANGSVCGSCWYATVEQGVEVEVSYTDDGNIQLPAGKYDIYFKVASTSMWIQTSETPEEPEPEPEPVVITFVDEVTFPKTFVGETTNDIIEFTLENAAEDAEVVVEVTGEAFSVAEVQDNFIFLAFAPEAEGEYEGVLTVTVGEVSETLEFTAVASPVEVEPEPTELEFALVGRLNGDNDNEILAFEDGYKFTKESEFVYTLNVTFTGAIESGDKLIQKVKLVDAEGNIWARNSSKTIKPSDGTSTMTKGETASSTYLVTEVGVEYKITYTLVSDEANSLYKLSGQITFEEVQTEEPDPTPDPVINVIVADFERNTAEVGDETDAAIVYSLENIESAEVEIEGEYVTFEQIEVEEGFMIAVFFRPEEVGEFPGKVIITAGEVSEEVEFTFIATEPEEPDNTITFTVQVPEGTKECYVVGSSENESESWGIFYKMELVEGEEDLYTFTTTTDVLNGKEWKYSSGQGWDYVELTATGADVDNRKVAGNPDVVERWKKIYDPDFEPIEPYYAIRGLNGDASWTGSGDIKLEESADGSEWFALGFTVAEGESFKVIYIDENADVSGYYAALEESCNVGQTYDGNGNLVLPAGTYDLYFKSVSKLMWIAKKDTPTDVEDAAAELIYAVDGTIIAPAPFAIIDLSGKDVTNANGSLQGTYIVKTQNSTAKISVK